MKKLLVGFSCILFLISCQEKTADFVAQTEAAHNKDAFLKQEIVTFDIESSFGSNKWVDATISLTTDSGKGKITFKDSTEIIYNGADVYYSPKIKDTANIRFNAYTIPYFFQLPYKLSDGGTIFTNYQNIEKDNEDFNSKKLSFKANIGDAPNDWYVLYTNKKTNLLQKTAYIVTANSAKEDAEKNPHAIEYLNYQEVNGIPFATNWLFYEWKQNIGLTKEIGKASISNIRFEKATKDFFTPGTDFVKK
ncbi:MAG: hypothetical protein ACI9XR_002297 [Flavobacterium sp.]|jgi:hypothetical protein